MDEVREIVAPDDPRMAKLMACAKALMEAAEEVAGSTAEPGRERLQALHFAFTGCLNHSGLDHGDVALALGTVVGMAYITAQVERGPFAAEEFNEAFNAQVPITIQDLTERHRRSRG